MGPASTSPRAFHGWTRKPPCFPGFAWWIKLGPGSFDVKPWSGRVLKKSFEWRALFQRKSALTECTWSLEVVLSWKSLLSDVRSFEEKVHLLSVAPEPLAIWNKKLEGLESLSLEKLKISSEDMYPAAPEHISRFFWFKKNSDIGSFVIFSSNLLSVRGCHVSSFVLLE